MRISGQAPKGSFTSPEELMQTVNEFKATEKPKETQKENQPEQDSGQMFADDVTPEPENKVKSPEENLEVLGVEISDEDVMQYLLLGGLTKTVTLYSRNDRKYTAEVRTLSTDDLEMIDTFLAEETKKEDMLQAGLEMRRASWTVAFAVSKINGRNIAPSTKEMTKKEQMRKRKDVIRSLSAHMVDLLARKHYLFVSNLNLLLEENEGALVKK
jgi:hypothetical protein